LFKASFELWGNSSFSIRAKERVNNKDDVIQNTPRENDDADDAPLSNDLLFYSRRRRNHVFFFTFFFFASSDSFVPSRPERNLENHSRRVPPADALEGRTPVRRQIRRVRGEEQERPGQEIPPVTPKREMGPGSESERKFEQMWWKVFPTAEEQK
jgi:hypothetical protein